MLERLTIENYALIDTLRLEPDRGLSIITGETGAGKSIMLGALGLLLGERADSGVITDKSRKTVVEAEFSSLPDGVKALVKAIDDEYDGGTLTVRREISPNGRSRAFVCDTPVKLPELTAVTCGLIDIHSQHNNMLLSRHDQQLSLIDLFAGNAQLLADYRHEFSEYIRLLKRIRDIKEENERNRVNREMYEYQLEQLDKLDAKPGELESVERRFDILSDSEEIRENLTSALDALSGENFSALSQVARAIEMTDRVDMALFEPDTASASEVVATLKDFTISERLRQVNIELKDIAETLGKYASEVDADPNELERVTNRMNSLYAANRQFRISEPDGLVKMRESLREKLGKISGKDENLQALEQKARTSAKNIRQKANLLTESRKKGAEEFSELLNRTARPLGLTNLQFEVEMDNGKFTRDGADVVRFMCSFNKNMPMQDMIKVASGGEMSRLMLSIKSIVAGRMKLPTVVFDEIDTGVSGEIADKMGAMMQQMGSTTQVITITHLPQVAAKGARHFKVYKEDNDLRTVSSIRMLDDEERVREIAGMISGEKLNEAALNAARTLLS
ncbi:MAG: DNA repair protein RecN [Muribaculum sp.]|nr:DNA repair protein RecN [Muribaculum sp.]